MEQSQEVYWTPTRLNALRRDLAFEGYAYIELRYVDELERTISFPLKRVREMGKHVRLEIDMMSPSEKGTMIHQAIEKGEIELK